MLRFLKKNYHWIIALLVLLQMAVSGGTTNNAFSMFLLPITEDLGISRGDFSLAHSMRAVMAFVSTLAAGVLINRFGYRKMVFVSLLAVMLGFVLIGCSQEAFLLGAGYALVGASEGLCATAGASRIITAWFHRYRGTMLGFVTAATGLGGSLMCLVLSAIIQNFNWRTASLSCSGILLLVAVLMLLIIRDAPERLGLQPYGAGQTQEKTKVTTRWLGFTLQQLYRRPTFYMMLFGTFFSCFLIFLAQPVVVPYLQDCGLSATQAASFQSLMMFCMAGAKFFSGLLCDRIGAKRVTLLCLGACALGMVLLAVLQGVLSAAAAIIVLSASMPLLTVTIPMLSAELFGQRAQGIVAGIFISMMSAALVLAVPAANFAYDILGSYRPVYWAASVAAAALMGWYLWLYALAERDKKNME